MFGEDSFCTDVACFHEQYAGSSRLPESLSIRLNEL